MGTSTGFADDAQHDARHPRPAARRAFFHRVIQKVAAGATSMSEAEAVPGAGVEPARFLGEGF
jgi:hypothetical protein